MEKLLDAALTASEERGFKTEILFRWDLTDRAIRITERDGMRLTLTLNRRLLEKRDTASLAAEYVKAQIRLTGAVRTSLPRSYSEGLAFLFRISAAASPRGLCCGSPVSPERLTAKRRPRNLAAEDLWCTAEAMEACRESGSCAPGLTEELPEIIYGRDGLPRNAALCAAARISAVTDTGDCPILSLPRRYGDIRSPAALLLAYAESGNPFFCGLAVRTMVWGSPEEAARVLDTGDLREIAAACAGSYIRMCRDRAAATSDLSPCALTDNRLAADATVTRLYRLFGGTLPGTECGSLYPIRRTADV